MTFMFKVEKRLIKTWKDKPFMYTKSRKLCRSLGEPRKQTRNLKNFLNRSYSTFEVSLTIY